MSFWLKETKKLIQFKEIFRQIKTIGITNQRETTVCWDRETGEPLHNAIVWHDTRTQSIVEQFEKEQFYSIVGLPCAIYFSAFKIKWLIDNVLKTVSENVCFGTIDTWLVYV